ncbi:hypothetical protein D3C76_1664370 [compost metagenome]
MLAQELIRIVGIEVGHDFHAVGGGSCGLLIQGGHDQKRGVAGLKNNAQKTFVRIAEKTG